MDRGDTVLGSNRTNGSANVVAANTFCSSDTSLTSRCCISLEVKGVESMRKRVKVAADSEWFGRPPAVVTPQRSARELLRLHAENASAVG